MFYKKVNKNNNKEMYEFLKEHTEYWTMNSWNRLYSIANNVKIYNLKLEGDYWRALEMLQRDNYSEVNDFIIYWEEEHQNYTVGFNGRSGGYLVLYNKKNNGNVLDYYITNSDNYEDFKELLKDYNITLKDYHTTLLEQVELVQDFDKLCDDLRLVCQDLINNYTYNEKGKCGVCGGTNLEYSEKQFDCEDIVRQDYVCKDCNTTGCEFYHLEFFENYIAERGDV